MYTISERASEREEERESERERERERICLLVRQSGIFASRQKKRSCAWGKTCAASLKGKWYNLLHLECHFFYLESQLII